MARKNRSKRELLDISEKHLFYEIQMLYDSARLIGNEIIQQNDILRNGLIEAFTIHLRVLFKFFYDDRPFDSDVIANDFYKNPDEWNIIKRKYEDKKIIAKICKRVNKEIAHLTYDRLKVTPEEKSWLEPGGLAFKLIESAYINFLLTVDEQKIGNNLLVDKKRVVHLKNGINDYPKSLKDPIEIEKRKLMLHKKHMAPLTRFVDNIRKIQGKNYLVPYFDPLDAGIRAECLFVLEAPGGKAIKSGFVSRNNNDETAKNFFQFNLEAGIPRDKTIIWNIIPWYLGSGKKIRAAKSKDRKTGFPYLLQLMDLLPNLKVIILMGNNALNIKDELQKHWKNRVINCYHPSPQVVNTKKDNKEKIMEKLEEVAHILK